jgi:hypothetical protein
LGERSEAFARRFDFDGSALGSLVGQGLSLTPIGNWKEATVGEISVAAAGMCDKDDARLESFAYGVDEV